ncbi:MAG: tat (twin-arginine translocation) pathway signal sequence, partial [Acidobacteria bacterium Pan2503]|nr:tat (twin-arginine translocation) pathway signal sequence [Candidatus Acidoferrum panamensis]
MDELRHLNRRKLLKTTTGILAGLVIPGSPFARIARGPAWAVDLTSLTSVEGATLLAMAR